MRKAILLLTVIIGLAACKKEVTKFVDQDKVWTSYELFYDQNVGKTYATATFKFSNEFGTALQLSEPSTVTVDGSEMEWSDETASYHKEYTGSHPTAIFNWIDLDGKSFTNTIDVRDIEYPSFWVDTLFHADSITLFSWEGLPLDSFETVRLTLDGEGTSDARIFSVDSFGATTITIDSTLLSQVDSGLVQLILDKTYGPNLQEETSRGGLLVGKYRPTNGSVFLD